ncbi:uncharacterized protein LOC143865807 [Tasmannia lanceolata]|uniref:uncharacterized protein LOC143865807 n=1 Tax=Tasmannia lanceolata TaxID=3420 RepID=UPI00406446F3
MKTFLVVKVPSTYNAIIGRPALNKLEAVVSKPHLKIKFPTKIVGEVRGDQERARNCYANYTRVVKKAKESLQIAGTDPHSDNYKMSREPVEELTQVPLFGEDDDRTIQIGSLLTGKTRTNLVNFLKANADVFAWSALDMLGIPTNVAVQRLSVDPSHRPVKQKKQNFAPERQKAIKEEVDKLLQAGFIQEIHYPEWLANVVMIRMYSPDIPKTSFVTEQGLFCYKVIPFGLKNTGATYQRLEAFAVLQKYQMKLNPSKCAFGVTSRKFLGFMVTQRGIEANPEKIQVILDMTSPKTVNEVQQLARRIAALSRFMSKSAERCLPFF